MATPKRKAKVEGIELPKLELEVMELIIVGQSPLICHRWSKKAKKEILDKQMKKAKRAKEAKDPDADYRASLYILEELTDGAEKGFGFPSVAFKKSAVDACSHVDGVTKVLARGAFHVLGEYVRINGEPRMREDMVRLSGVGSVADIRFRGEFPDWWAKLEIQFNKRVLSAEQIANLFNISGFAIGIGEWRPQRDGIFGRFNVATAQQARKLLKRAA